MPTADRRQKERGRQDITPEIEAFITIVNDGCFLFPHNYIRHRASRFATHAVLELPLQFDAAANDLHAEVRTAAIAIADELVAAALTAPPRLLPDTFGNTRHPVLPKGYLLLETRAASIDARNVLQQRTIDGVTQYRRDPDDAVEQAARTALWTVRDAIEQLVDRGPGGYQCLHRCQRGGCNRLFFRMSDSRLSCDLHARTKRPKRANGVVDT